MPIFSLSTSNEFPPVEYAEPDGLLAVGGDLSLPRLLNAYSHGIFPWYSHGEPILWWSPDPRTVLFPAEVKVSKSMRQLLRKKIFTVKADQAFEAVMRNCMEIERPDQDGTWINENMIASYSALHKAGFAHSVEVYENESLVGGLYGVTIGKVFYGESMFSLKSNTSKLAFIALCRFMEKEGFRIIDCQVYNEHLASLGAVEIPRKEFVRIMNKGILEKYSGLNWQEIDFSNLFDQI